MPKQFKRACKILKNLETIAGRVMRDVELKIDVAAFQKHKGKCMLSDIILTRRHTTRGNLIEHPIGDQNICVYRNPVPNSPDS